MSAQELKKGLICWLSKQPVTALRSPSLQPVELSPAHLHKSIPALKLSKGQITHLVLRFKGNSIAIFTTGCSAASTLELFIKRMGFPGTQDLLKFACPCLVALTPPPWTLCSPSNVLFPFLPLPLPWNDVLALHLLMVCSLSSLAALATRHLQLSACTCVCLHRRPPEVLEWCLSQGRTPSPQRRAWVHTRTFRPAKGVWRVELAGSFPFCLSVSGMLDANIQLSYVCVKHELKCNYSWQCGLRAE